jgi:hypothetical protein
MDEIYLNILEKQNKKKLILEGSDNFGKLERSFFIYAYPNLLLTVIPPLS